MCIRDRTYIGTYAYIPAGFTPKIVLIQPISGATFLHAIIRGCGVTTGIYGSIPFSFLFLDTKSIVISSIPMGIHLHVLLTLYTSLFVIFGLFLSAQSMPLKIKGEKTIHSLLTIGWKYIYQTISPIFVWNQRFTRSKTLWVHFGASGPYKCDFSTSFRKRKKEKKICFI